MCWQKRLGVKIDVASNCLYWRFNKSTSMQQRFSCSAAFRTPFKTMSIYLNLLGNFSEETCYSKRRQIPVHNNICTNCTKCSDIKDNHIRSCVNNLRLSASDQMLETSGVYLWHQILSENKHSRIYDVQ